MLHSFNGHPDSSLMASLASRVLYSLSLTAAQAGILKYGLQIIFHFKTNFISSTAYVIFSQDSLQKP